MLSKLKKLAYLLVLPYHSKTKTSEEWFEIENPLSFILFGALNVFEDLFNICKDVHFHGVFHFLFIFKGLQTIRSQGFAQSVHKQSAHKGLFNLLVNNQPTRVY